MITPADNQDRFELRYSKKKTSKVEKESVLRNATSANLPPLYRANLRTTCTHNCNGVDKSLEDLIRTPAADIQCLGAPVILVQKN